MSFRKSESGNVLVLTAMCLTILMGFVAMAIDVGMLFHAHVQMQIAADAAAAAAALDYKYGESTRVQSDATAAATQNGMLATGSATINDPPTSGYHKAAGYIEAVVSEPYPTFFMKTFGFGAINVSARAVAGSSANGGCMWALAKSGVDISLKGNGSLTAQNCAVYDDSSASDALQLKGNGSISAKSIGIVGGYTVNGNGSITPNPPTTGIAPAADPINVTPPTASTSTCSGSSSACNPSNSSNNNKTIQPGTYTSITNSGNGNMTLAAGNYTITGNLTNSANGSLTLGAGNYTIGGNFSTSGNGAVTIGAGEYIIGGNLSLQGNGALTGSGVTFFIASGSNTVVGNGNMNLSAPTSGPYSGLLYYEPLSNNNGVSLTGNGGDNVQGIMYMPGAPVTLAGNGNLTVSLDLIADSISSTGNGSITLTNYAAIDNESSVLSKLAMVE